MFVFLLDTSTDWAGWAHPPSEQKQMDLEKLRSVRAGMDLEKLRYVRADGS